MRAVPKRAGKIGLALTAYELWKRLPPKQRQAILRNARTKGPQLAARALEARRKRRGGGPNL
jgi:hypothetical protein